MLSRRGDGRIQYACNLCDHINDADGVLAVWQNLDDKSWVTRDHNDTYIHLCNHCLDSIFNLREISVEKT